MRICLYSLSPKVGGGVVVKTILLLQYLIARGHQVVWVYPKVKGTLPAYVVEFLHHHNLPTIEKSTVPYLRALDSLDFFSEVKGDFDIYQVVSGYCSDGLVFSRLPGQFFIWSATTLKAEKFDQSLLKIRSPKDIVSYINYKCGLVLEKYAARRAYRVFAASSPSRENIIRDLALEHKKVKVISPIIDTEKYEFKPMGARDTTEAYVLFMGIFSRRKNIDLLIRSFALVIQKCPQLKLMLVGKENGFGGYFKQLIFDNGLNDNVLIVGEVDDNVVWYQNAVCTVLTSFEEGFGMVLAESLSCGTPVIATRSGGVSDIVQSGVNGFLVDFCEKQVSDSIIKLFEDHDMRERFSINGRNHVESSFSVSKIGDIFINEYRTFLSGISSEG